MMFGDPHGGRFLLACILNNQLLSGGSPCGSLAGATEETCPREPWGPWLKGEEVAGARGGGDEGCRLTPRLSIGRFVGTLGARSGDSVRAIPLTLM